MSRKRPRGGDGPRAKQNAAAGPGRSFGAGPAQGSPPDPAAREVVDKVRGEREGPRRSVPPGETLTAPAPREWEILISSALALGLAAGFYAWMLGRPASV